MHAKQRLNKLEKELEKHTGGKIAKADKIQVLHWRTEKEREDKVKNRMAELLHKYPKASRRFHIYFITKFWHERGL